MGLLEKDLKEAKENAKRSQEEVDRLLKLVQMSQEEQNTKERQIHDLQTYVLIPFLKRIIDSIGRRKKIYIYIFKPSGPSKMLRLS